MKQRTSARAPRVNQAQMDKIIEDQLKMMPLELDAPRNRTLCAEAWFDRSTRTGTHIETPSLRTKP